MSDISDTGKIEDGEGEIINVLTDSPSQELLEFMGYLVRQLQGFPFAIAEKGRGR